MKVFAVARYLLVVPLLLGAVSSNQNPLIPVEDLFRSPEVSELALSESGHMVAYLAPYNNRLNVYVQSTANLSDPPQRITSYEDDQVIDIFWIGDDRVGFLRDRGGDENYHVYSVKTDGSDVRDLTPFEGSTINSIIVPENDNSYIIVGSNRRDSSIFDAYRIDVATGDTTMIFRNPGNIASWTANAQGELLLFTTTDGVNVSLLYRKTPQDSLTTVVTTTFREALIPQFFDYNNPTRIYAVSNLNRDKSAAVLYNLETAEEDSVIYIHPDVDVTGIKRSKSRRVATEVDYYTFRAQRHFIDETSRRLREAIEKQVPTGSDFSIVSQNKAENIMIVRTFSDKSRGAYYLYYAPDNKLVHYRDISPWLDKYAMAETRPITYKSRDGLTIHGYLTIPAGVEAENLPVIINPHGGPWYRDIWRFNPEAQLFANRGYAVLQMNFRGSTGYGKEFLEKSYKQWGLAMQDDITDGVHWLIDQGIADPERIGIYGGSYGGYATLAGITKTPDLYACAVSYVGVSNIFTWINAIPPYWTPMREMFYEMIGNPNDPADSAMLYSSSPLFQADKIKIPLMVVQGANDPRVKKEESDQIVEALRQRGVEVKYIVKDNEGHGFANEENRLELYREMDQFFGECLGGRMGKL